MTIAVAGTGYVGLSNSILLSQHNKVYAVDIVQEKVDLINSKKSPIVDKEISEYLFCDQSLYSKYERGLRPIPVDFVIKLALLYNTSTDYILGLTDTPEPYPKAKKTDDL